MNTFDDIEALWKKPRQLQLPDAADIIKKASREKNKLANKILVQVICLMLAIASMLIVLFTIDFKYATSYAGLALMSACVIVFSIIRFRQTQHLRNMDFSQSPSALLQQFERFYSHQKYVNTTGVMWYTIVLNLAFAFYFYETLVLAPMLMFWKIIFLVVYVIWMLIATLWLGKRSVRKEHGRTTAIIEKLKQVQSGFEL